MPLPMMIAPTIDTAAPATLSDAIARSSNGRLNSAVVVAATAAVGRAVCGDSAVGDACRENSGDPKT